MIKMENDFIVNENLTINEFKLIDDKIHTFLKFGVEYDYKEVGFEYLFGANSKAINGKYLTNHKAVDKIRDDAIKGECSLEYEWVDNE